MGVLQTMTKEFYSKHYYQDQNISMYKVKVTYKDKQGSGTTCATEILKPTTYAYWDTDPLLKFKKRIKETAFYQLPIRYGGHTIINGEEEGDVIIATHRILEVEVMEVQEYHVRHRGIYQRKWILGIFFEDVFVDYEWEYSRIDIPPQERTSSIVRGSYPIGLDWKEKV